MPLAVMTVRNAEYQMANVEKDINTGQSNHVKRLILDNFFTWLIF